ncbi:type VI secretion system baseplate subunit TssF [Candidatus Sneabacter namystus]|uniref:Type VI secretion system baseplate subunit TssF n=1 Tax=Candidatus Sneabacter namystus TaxID=2601646 RepID=A0A5C0UJE4_9RICK|nr:type VI secretion system baseplate subunit TssF [Candidatus Sneabacter namystus]QEK39909.1 type VI secretion system baseplate subunit TssF [Candidatus Sneabacter namystus]
MQDPEIKKQLALRLSALYEDVKDFSKHYSDTYLGSVTENPHITRLIESFAFLHNNFLNYALDVKHSYLVSSILDLLYPHLTRPIPSVMFIKMVPDAKQEQSIFISNKTLLEVEYKEMNATFKVGYDTEVVPLAIDSIKSFNVENDKSSPTGSVSCMSLLVSSTNDHSIDTLGVKKIRFFLQDIKHISYMLYESLFSYLTGIIIEDETSCKKVVLSKESVSSVGLKLDENLLYHNNKTFPGYLFLTEFFLFPQKFLFFDLNVENKLSNFSSSVKIKFYFSNHFVIDSVSNNTLAMNVIPTINLFEKESDPVVMEDGKIEYPLIIDKQKPQQYSIYSIQKVVVGLGDEQMLAKPLAQSASETSDTILWHVERKTSASLNSVPYISFVTKNSTKEKPYFYANALCFNGNIPYEIFLTSQRQVQLRFMDDTILTGKIEVIKNPSKVQYICSNVDKKIQVLTHLSAHYISIIGSDVKGFLKDIISVYQGAIPALNNSILDSIADVAVETAVERVNTVNGPKFCTGFLCKVVFVLPEKSDIDRGVLYLFSQIFEKVLIYYCSMNSFIKLNTYISDQALYVGPLRISST